jgi:glycosyltransferase involved in cell wall biosynthesis
VVTNSLTEKTEVSKTGNLVVYKLPLFKGTAVKFLISLRFDTLCSHFVKEAVEWANVIYIPRFWFSAIPLARAHRKPIVTHLHDYITRCPLAIAYDSSRANICDQIHAICPFRCIYADAKKDNLDLKNTVLSLALNSSLGRIIPKLVRLSNAVICVSKAQRDILVEHDPALRGKTHVVYNPLPELPEISVQGDCFGYFGGTNYLKGFSSLCRAIIHVNHTERALTKIHATKFSNLRESISSLLGGLGFILHGKLNDDEFREVYKQIRAVIVPSIWQDPSPYVIDEAMMRGRVVIASRTGGIPEQVSGSKGAFLFEPGNVSQLAGIISLVKGLTKESIIDLGAQNRESLMKTRNNDETIRHFIDILYRIDLHD